MDVMRAAAAAASAGSFLDKAHLNAPHLLLPPFPRDRNTLHVLCSSHPLVDASNTPSPFHAHRIAPADAKTLYLLRKKEAWKARRRERKEKEKSERVTDPVWYELSEKEVSIEREKFRILDARGDYADEFLCHMRDQRPAQRIVMDGSDVIMPVLSKKKISRMRRSRVASKKPTAVTESLVASFVHDAGNTPMKTRNNEDFDVPAVDESGRLNPLCDDDLNPKHQSQRIAYTERSEFSAASGKATLNKETILHFDPRRETAPCIDWPPSPSHSSPSIAVRTSFNANRNLNTSAKIQASLGNDIESFSDDEVPKIAEMWKKGVGIVKFRKFLISREEKERINARKRGNWNVLSEFTEDEDVQNETVPFPPFDGKAALLEDKKIQKLAARLNDIDYWTSKFYFSKVMHSGRMKLTENRVLRIVEILGEWGNWRRAMQVVQWVHKRQQYQFHKSKFIFTTLLSVLGKAKRHVEALNVFSVMRENYTSYPDMAAYHAVAVILGQCGCLKELLQLIESLKMGPPKPIKFVPVLTWSPSLQPDIVVYNAVLNACIPNKEWAGVFWTWDLMEEQRIRPNGATFGLTIEAMVKAGNFDEAIRYYKRMERAGFPANAHTYKFLVETFCEAKMPDEAIQLVNVMEASGTVATASVYFALACGLCVAGRLKEALFQVNKMQDIPSRKPDVITFTGLIKSCGKVGRVQDATFLFKHMQHICAPNVRTCNEMIKLYGRNGMFEEAKTIYESIRRGWIDSCIFFDKDNKLHCDSFTFELMLKASAISQRWEYFYKVYKEMLLCGFYLSGKSSLWVMIRVARLKQFNLVDDMISQLRKAGEIPDLQLYEAQILSCLQEQCFQRALIYLDETIKDGYEIASALKSISNQAQKETWDNFLKQAGSWEPILSCI